ncbi:MAG: chromate efflux transporter [Pseudomonadota bacterium]|nr:chromate efflux transporter [Pseudomonadota bacterium]MEE3070168.1 chromate efflux transporter [Pseudomonadota bacterium]
MSSIPFSDLFRVFGRIGLLSFGGPAAQISLMHKELVEDRPWLTEAQFLRALSFCMLLPGPEAMQLATYSGWRLRGIAGGLIAGLLFVVPGALLILALGLAYALWGQLPLMQAMFTGIQAAVIIIVLQALMKVSKKALKAPLDWAIAAGSFIALFAFDAPFPMVIIWAAVIGSIDTPRFEPTEAPDQAGRGNYTLTVIFIGLLLWLTPLLIAYALDASFLTQIFVFFSKLAVVTFGGAYAVLTYMTQEVVGTYQWITTEQMIDALGLAETTPGPLILVTEFVALLAGYAQGGIPQAILAAGMCLWVTFVPCFIWIFAGAPYIEKLGNAPRFAKALHAITAAVVGVILNLSIWFALHVFFAETSILSWGPMTLTIPQFQTLAFESVGFSLVAAIVLLWRKWDIARTIVFMAVLSAILTGLT